MAKYEITFSCGHTEIKQLYGPTKERERKIEYFKKEGLCSECYKAYMREQEQKQPLTCIIRSIGELNENYEPQMELWFTGNTTDNKEKIKGLGYRWGNLCNPYDFGLFWNKIISEEKVNDEIAAIKASFPDVVVKIHPCNKQISTSMSQKRKELLEIQNRLNVIPKPEIPELVKEKKWNHTFYGRTGNQSIYLDGAKVRVSEEEVEELETYLKDKKKYNETMDFLKKAETLKEYEELWNELEKKKQALVNLEKPAVPGIINGKKWNERFYGKTGSQSIYLDGEKVRISEEEVKELKKYLAATDAYKKSVKELKA